MIKPWKKWSLGFTGVVVALGAVKAAGYPVEEARPALRYELTELSDKVDGNTISRLVPIYDMYRRRVDKLSKKQNMTPDERGELNYARVQKDKIRKQLIKAGYDPEPPKKD